MYVILFEDEEKTPSSQLLSASYNGKNIHFGEGGGSLRSKVNGLLRNGNTHILVFVDVNPNNSDTEDLFEHLLGYRAKNSSWRDVILVPIICIEYYIALTCKLNNWFGARQWALPSVRYFIQDLRVDKLNPRFRTASLETICKRIFNEANTDCQVNESKGKNIFYTSDCNCPDCSVRATREEKANKLYCSLPVFETIDKIHELYLNRFGIYLKVISLDELAENVNQFYRAVYKCCGKSWTDIFY